MRHPVCTSLTLLALMLCRGGAVTAQQTAASPAGLRHITLAEAVQLALAHNHGVRIAGYKVEEKEHQKDVAKSFYYPSLKNESTVVHLTDVQHVEIPAGAFGTDIPAQPITLFQGGQTFETSGTSLSEPLTTLLKVKEKNDMAAADWNATRAQADQVRNQVALKVRQIYYGLLIAQLRRSALQAGSGASEQAEKERAEQVKVGSALDADLLESRAQALQSKQELLSEELQISDLTTQLDDVIGLPLGTQLALDTVVPQVEQPCSLEECKKLAVESHPDVKVAEQQVAGASASVRLARRDFLPDTEVFARYSYQNNVPFLVHNFGTFGFLMTYDIFDGGRKRATLAEQKSQLDEASENLARVKEEVELGVQMAYNKLERTREMVNEAQELLALREESKRVASQQLQRGAVLTSQADLADAHELEAQASLLQAQLDYLQSYDELSVATGQSPR
jgi:outer membrane protein TolC